MITSKGELPRRKRLDKQLKGTHRLQNKGTGITSSSMHPQRSQQKIMVGNGSKNKNSINIEIMNNSGIVSTMKQSNRTITINNNIESEIGTQVTFNNNE